MEVSPGLALVVSNWEGCTEEVRPLLQELGVTQDTHCVILCGGGKPPRRPAHGQKLFWITCGGAGQ